MGMVTVIPDVPVKSGGGVRRKIHLNRFGETYEELKQRVVDTGMATVEEVRAAYHAENHGGRGSHALALRSLTEKWPHPTRGSLLPAPEVVIHQAAPRAPEPVPVALEVFGGVLGSEELSSTESLKFVYEHVGDAMLPHEVPSKGTLAMLMWARKDDNRESFYRMWKEASLKKQELEKGSAESLPANKNRDLREKLRRVVNGP
jgi:hypothetical protein